MSEPDSVVVSDQQVPEVAANPMAMLAHAVARGTSPDELSKLMDLQERWQKEEARKAFVSALNAFKADPPQIFKNKDVAHNGKFMYSHATLDNASAAIGAALARHNISHRWDTEQLEDKTIKVTCVLTHALGHSERTPLQAAPDASGSKNSIQAIGSTVTYLQRYTLLAATGMAVSGQDDDGRQGKKMAPDDIEKYKAAIAGLSAEGDAVKLWQQIAQACTAAGDVEMYEEFRADMTAKRKMLKSKPEAV